ncbi:MAG: twin-arginine translocase subunit TatB [Clostridiales bacterium]|nr:twin-arginine translocase subunit TatB [Clostridiales bacterium]
MFNIGMMELVLILLVAFLVVGPKDLPKVARWIARQIKNLRKLVREVKKETGWDDLAAEFKDTGDEIRGTLKEADIRTELQQAAQSVEQEIKSVQDEVDAATQQIKTETKSIQSDLEGGN